MMNAAVAEDRLETAVERSSVGERCQMQLRLGERARATTVARVGDDCAFMNLRVFRWWSSGEVGEPTGEGIYLLVLFLRSKAEPRAETKQAAWPEWKGRARDARALGGERRDRA